MLSAEGLGELVVLPGFGGIQHGHLERQQPLQDFLIYRHLSARPSHQG